MVTPSPTVQPVGVSSLLRIAAPIILSSALTLVLKLNDTVILGRSGAEVATAAVLATATYFVLIGTVSGFALPAQVLTARRTGQETTRARPEPPRPRAPWPARWPVSSRCC